jgi:hypothetical protein
MVFAHDRRNGIQSCCSNHSPSFEHSNNVTSFIYDNGQLMNRKTVSKKYLSYSELYNDQLCTYTIMNRI